MKTLPFINGRDEAKFLSSYLGGAEGTAVITSWQGKKVIARFSGNSAEGRNYCDSNLVFPCGEVNKSKIAKIKSQLGTILEASGRPNVMEIPPDSWWDDELEAGDLYTTFMDTEKALKEFFNAKS